MKLQRQSSAYDPMTLNRQTSRWLVRLMLVLGILGMAYLRGGSATYLARVGLALLWAGLLPFAFRGASNWIEEQPRLTAWKVPLKTTAGLLLLATFLLGAWVLVVR